jgi:hypothetical protein
MFRSWGFLLEPIAWTVVVRKTLSRRSRGALLNWAWVSAWIAAPPEPPKRDSKVSEHAFALDASLQFVSVSSSPTSVVQR